MKIESARGVFRLVDPLEELADRIRSKEARVGVVGLGYVGLPMLVTAARSGFRVIGVDVDVGRIEALRNHRSYLVDVTDADLALLGEAEFGTDASALAAADVTLICVPTPLTDHNPDLAMVREATEAVGRHLAPGRLVVLESTTYPGTTEEIVAPLLEEASGLTPGVDVALAYSPERIDPGQDDHRLDETPKIVAGYTDRCRDLAVAFYGQMIRQVVTAPSPRDAEMAKLIENTFRQVNIALVNELAVLARDLDVDIWEALRAASTKPFGYMPFWPGPGVGGHCIAIDPSYLSWRVGQRLGYHIGFIEHANEVNNRMPAYVVDRIGDALNDAGKPIRGSRILALGVTYKPGVNDRRGSPSLMVIERLLAKGATVAYHDPFVPDLDVGGQTLTSVPLTDEHLAEQDCVAILTAHPSIDYAHVARGAELVFDARGATLGLDASNIVRL